MTSVIRIQDAQGCGPYFSDYRYNHIDLHRMLREHDNNRPNPVGEGCSFNLRWECCHGFKNFEQMHKWFERDELRLLDHHGFKIVVLPVKRIVWEGEWQVLYFRSDVIEIDVEYKPLNMGERYE